MWVRLGELVVLRVWQLTHRPPGDAQGLDVGLIARTCHMLQQKRTIHHHWTYAYKHPYARASVRTGFAEAWVVPSCKKIYFNKVCSRKKFSYLSHQICPNISPYWKYCSTSVYVLYMSVGVVTTHSYSQVVKYWSFVKPASRYLQGALQICAQDTQNLLIPSQYYQVLWLFTNSSFNFLVAV